MKKRDLLTGLVMLFVLGIALSFPTSASADAPKDGGLGVVIVLDASASMRKTSDPHRIAIEAAKLFVDMSETRNSEVAVVSFNDSVTAMPVVGTETEAGRQTLREEIDGIRYTGYTDLGGALKEAQILTGNMLRRNPNRKCIVLLLSDGVIDIEDSSTKTEAESAQEMAAAQARFAASGVAVYAVGLDHQDSANRNDLTALADATGGKSYMTASAADLRGIVTDIFADCTNNRLEDVASFTATGEFNEIEFDIPNGSVWETNIVVLSGRRIKDIFLYAPDGSAADLAGDGYMSSQSDVYTFVKMIRPAAGRWKLCVRGVARDKISVLLSNNFSFSLNTTLLGGTLNNAATVTAALVPGEGVTLDDSFYNAVQMRLSITHDGAAKDELPMRYDANTRLFSVDVPLDAPGSYAFTCKATSALVAERSGETLTLIVQNNAPVLTEAFTRITLDTDRKGLQPLCDLAAFTDPDGDSIQLEALGYDASLLTVAQAADGLTAEALQSGKTQMTIRATDAHGASAEVTVQVKTRSFLSTLLLYGALALGLLGALAVVLALSKKRKRGAYCGSLFVMAQSMDGMFQGQSQTSIDMRRFHNRALSLGEAADADGAAFTDDTLRLLANRIRLSPAQAGMACELRWPQHKADAVNGKGSVIVEFPAQGVCFELTYTVESYGYTTQSGGAFSDADGAW